MKKILVTDLDGTLLDDHEKIHPIDLHFLHNLPEDVIFIPATGRSLDSTKHVFLNNGFDITKPFPYPVITLNGAMGFFPGEREVFYHALPPEIIEQVLPITRYFTDICFLLLDHSKAYMVNETKFGWLGEMRYKFGASPYSPDMGLDHFAKVMCLSDNRQALAGFQRRVANLPVTSAYSMETIYELTPSSINKGSALNQLLPGLLDGEGRIILAAGDGENDLDLLHMADVSFTSSESPEKIKQVADVIFEPSSGLLQFMLQHSK